MRPSLAIRTMLATSLLAVALAGCTPQTNTPAPVATPTAGPVATATAAPTAPGVVPSPTAAATVGPMVVPTPDPAADADLVAAAKANHAPLPAEDLAAFALAVPAGTPPLWAVHSIGMIDFPASGPQPSHFVAIYGRDGSAWQQVAYLDLNDVGMGPDFVGDGGVSQVPLDPSRVFIQVDGGAGAHGGIYQMLKLEGEELKTEVAGSAASPGFGRPQDLDGDGTPEIVLDVSDAYVFCYACGVRKTAYEVLVYDRAIGRLRQAVPRPIAGAQASNPAATAINDAVSLAAAGLWKDAAAAAARAEDAAAGLPAEDAATLRWNRAFIDLHSSTMAQRVADSPYPLLANVFYGDYAAAVEVMRANTPEEIFNPQTPLVVGTVAEGYEVPLVNNVAMATGPALSRDDDLAPAYFVRGWGRYLVDPASPEAQADVAKAAELAPNDELFTASAAYLAKQQ